MGARFYCAPELRDGRLQPGIPPQAADVYSLGKLLYWMLSYGRIFDREDHRKDEYLLGKHDPGAPEYPLVNQLLDLTIVADPFRRNFGCSATVGQGRRFDGRNQGWGARNYIEGPASLPILRSGGISNRREWSSNRGSRPIEITPNCPMKR